MKLAFAMIVRGSEEEAKMLERCLQSIAPYVDGIFITITQDNDAVRKVAKKYKAKISEYVWNDDFASARNFNFSQVPKEFDYIMWTDADDIWRGMEKLKSTIDKNKHADAFGFWYLYDWDEWKKPIVVHRKTMIVKNDGCAVWKGALHEDLEPNRVMSTFLVEGIERLHLTNKARSNENALRNVRIAAKEAENTNDPRNAWNLANSQFAVSDFESSKRTFEEFIKTSHSQEEIYLARTRLSNVYKALGRREDCIRELQTAIGLQPSLPDAYLQLASYHYDFNNMDKAEEYCLQGMVKRPQIHKMIVYNPRDYDYNPMMLLAKIYSQKSRPDLMLPLLKGCLKIYPNDEKIKSYVREGEKDKKMLEKALIRVQKLQKIKDKAKLKKALDALPSDLKSHPAISVIRNQNFIKTESSGRDLVIYCGNTIEQWNPELAKTKMVGGSEEAVLYLSRELAKLGWNVTVYNNCGHKEMQETFSVNTTQGKANVFWVTYKPFWEWNYRDKQDVVILWRWAKPLDAEINAPKIFLDLHDVVSEGEFTEARLKKITKIFVKSQFHRSLFPNIPNDKFAIVPNGVELNIDPTIKRDPNLIINTSSPDRSMDVLPKMFKEIKKRFPKAKLKWAYGWEGFKNAHQADSKKMEWMEQTKKEIEDAGIEVLGRISQEEVGRLYQEALILAYPTEFAEIDCISVKKAQVAGCKPIATDFGALKESIRWGVKIHSKKTKDNWNRPYQFHFGLEDEAAQMEWIAEVVKQLKSKESVQGQGVDTAWSTTAKQWNKEMI